MATRKDVAERAGVSVATVSYVVNNTKHVTPQVRARVEEAIRELHYTPNLVARSLVTRRTQHVAMFVNNLKNPHYTEMLAGAQHAAGKKGYIVSIILIDYADPEEGLRLAARGVDGAILATVCPKETETLLGGLPCASPGEGVSCDFRQAIFDAVASLKEHGHRRIAYLGGLHPERNERFSMFKEALRENGLPADERLWVDGNEREDTDEEAGAAAMATLLERRVPFTAVMALNDLMAFGAQRELHARGLRVPEDVSVIGCDNTQMSRYYTPPLSTIDVSSFEMGSCLMEEIIAAIEGTERTKRIIKAAYLERESVARCREG